MKRTIIYSAFLIPFFLFLTFLFLLYSLPKAVVLDSLLSRFGLSLLAQRVEERTFTVLFEGVSLYRGGERLAQMEKLSLSITPLGISLSGRCGGGSLALRLRWRRELELHLKRATCISGFRSLEGKIRLSEGSVWGRLKAKGVELRGLNLDSADLDFEGESFKGRLLYGGMELRGGGRLRLNLKNPDRTYVDASFKGSLGTVHLRGRLSSISVQMR